MTRWLLAVALVLLAGRAAEAREAIRLANNPALSPDGQWLAFDWNGDIWIAPGQGGEARPLTAHRRRDTQPKFAPDGKTIAFISDRDGSPQVFTIPFDGGQPTQLTYHTAGARSARMDARRPTRSLSTRRAITSGGTANASSPSTARSAPPRRCCSTTTATTARCRPTASKPPLHARRRKLVAQGLHRARAPPRFGCYDRDARTFTKLLHRTVRHAAGRCGSPTARVSTSSPNTRTGRISRVYDFGAEDQQAADALQGRVGGLPVHRT